MFALFPPCLDINTDELTNVRDQHFRIIKWVQMIQSGLHPVKRYDDLIAREGKEANKLLTFLRNLWCEKLK